MEFFRHQLTASAVFSTRPRIQGKGTIWLDRSRALQDFGKAFERGGAHVCLNGPTGVGKTSLVRTYMAQRQIRHVEVVATTSLDWVTFCRRLVKPEMNAEGTIGADLEVGVDKLPYAKLKVSLGQKSRPEDSLDLIEKRASTWAEHEVAGELEKERAVLFLDDLDRASDDFLRRITDLCKLMIQNGTSDAAKVILVGTGDIYRRALRLNDYLEDRVAQTLLGGVNTPADSYMFLAQGFDALHLWHPWSSKLEKERQKQSSCVEAIWEAADGLPKSLNALGYELARAADSRSGVSASDILRVAAGMVEAHWVDYKDRFPQVLDFVYSEPNAADVVRCLYERGITRIHDVAKLAERVLATSSNPKPTFDAVESILEHLTALGFLVRTGKAGERVFPANPMAAHTLGVVMRDPGRFPYAPKQPTRPPLQLVFPAFSEAMSEQQMTLEV